MASGFFALLDDIAALMDDVALAAKVATKKTAGILGDDLAVNAEKATGFMSSREIPVLWAITKGSFVNKLIIVPIALVLNHYLPIAIEVALVLGGLYLAYEGVEKIIHFLFHRQKKSKEIVAEIEQNSDVAEKAKVKSAITTDFILSVEIVIIAMASAAAETMYVQILTVAVVAIVATVGVYGLVALIVRMDDAGYKLIKNSSEKSFLSGVGNLLVKALPVIIRILNVVGTIALILVAGGIFVHHIDYFHHILPNVSDSIKEPIFGLAAGLLMFGLIFIVKKVIALFKK